MRFIKMKKIIILILLTSCGPEPTYITKHGVEIYNPAPPKAGVELVFDTVLDYIPGPNKKLREDFRDDLYIKFRWGEDYDHLLPTVKCQSSPNGRCFGFTDFYSLGDDKMVITWRPGECVARTSIAHELIHIMEMMRYNIADGDKKHTDKNLWIGACGNDGYCVINTMEYKMYIQIADEVCNSEY